MTPRSAGGSVLLVAVGDKPTLRVAYFFSGIQRKSSLAQSLKRLLEPDGFGLIVYEVDILVHAKHNLIDEATQESWLSRIGDGEFDISV